MTAPLIAQVAVFALTIGIGLLLGLLFDFYRVVRGRLRPGRFATAVGDLLFSLTATGVTFALLIVGNWGELRLYVWVGFLLGALSYRLFLSRTVISWLVALFTLVGRILAAVAGHLARLLRLPGEWNRRFWRRSWLGQALRRWWRWVRSDPPPSPPPPNAAPPA
ncbi:MAG: spore cortex biosynthesis protein YabQ [Betaproteobacteria bacterium]